MELERKDAWRDQAPRGRPAPPTLLHQLAAAGRDDCVHGLISQGADVNATCTLKLGPSGSRHSEVTPLAAAIAYNRPGAAQLLLAAGAELRPVVDPYRGRLPLLLVAIEADAADALDAMLRSGRCDAGEADGLPSPLEAALRVMVCGHRGNAVLDLLLAAPGVEMEGGAPTALDTGLHFAAAKGITQAVQPLLGAGADPNAVRTVPLSGWEYGDEMLGGADRLELAAPLHAAAYYSHAGAVGPLAAAGAAVDSRCGLGHTPLALAAMFSLRADRKACATVAALLAAGADPNARREHPDPAEHHPPLYYAIKNGSGAVCRLLLGAGAELEGVAPSAAALCALALRSHRPAENKLKLGTLRAAGVGLLTTGWRRGGATVLHEAAAHGLERAVVEMVAAGADAAADDDAGGTPLQALLRYAGERGGCRWQRRGGAEAVAELNLAGGGGGCGAWDAVPTEFGGLERYLGRCIREAPEHAGALFSKLNPAAQTAVREALLTLNRLLPGGEGLKELRHIIIGRAFA